MVKVIVADFKHDAQHRLGQFLDESDYDVLIEEDTDAYMPALGNNELDETRIAFKFRKNYFSKEEQDAAYIGLREAAIETQNRGLAAGPREGMLGNRAWVTEYQYDIVDYFLNPKPNLLGDDPIDEIKARHANKKVEISNRANVWSILKVDKAKFEFEDWIEETRRLSPDDQKKSAKWVAEDLICATTYANSVNSGIAGWFDRYPRIPFGRATSYTENSFDKFKMSFPFLQSLAKGFKDLLPWRYGNQMAAAAKIDPEFLVPGTPFTTVTVNKTFRTAAHYDAGDLDSGLSNLLVLSNNGNFTGGYLVFPEYRMAVNVRPGDLLLVNNHEVMHGNTPIVLDDAESERVSLVVYFREKMLELGTKVYEDTRKQFVEDRRRNKEHPEQRPLWNGVSPGQWDTKEWYDYCENKLGKETLIKYHPESVKANSLEEFF